MVVLARNVVLIVIAASLTALSLKWNWVQLPAGAVWGVIAALIWQYLHRETGNGLRGSDIIRLNTTLRQVSIRISISGLLRIRLGDRYLLVRSQRIPGQYQPVGGALKFFESARHSLRQFHCDFVTGYGDDKDLENDLRLSVPGKFASRLIRWFRQSDDRERSPWREFHEELIETGILPAQVFPWLQFRKERTHVEPLRYSDHFQKHEILLAEIYEPVFNEEQVDALQKLSNTSPIDDSFVLADWDSIQRLGHDTRAEHPEIRIGKHTQWIVEGAHADT